MDARGRPWRGQSSFDLVGPNSSSYSSSRRDVRAGRDTRRRCEGQHPRIATRIPRLVHAAGRPIALVAWRLLDPALKRQDAFAHQLDERPRDRGVELAAGAAYE